MEERDCLKNESIGMLLDHLIPRFETKHDKVLCVNILTVSLIPVNTCSWQAEVGDG